MDMLSDHDARGHLAKALLGASVAASGAAPPAGAVEAVSNVGALLSRLSQRRRGQANVALAQARRAMEAEWEEWGRLSHADAGARESAKAAFRAVAPQLVFTAAEVAGRNLDPEAIARAALAKAAAAKPSLYGDPSPRNADHHLARTFLLRLTERAYAALIAEPGYMEEIAPALWREALGRLGDVKDDTAAIRDEQALEAERDAARHIEIMEALRRMGAVEQARTAGVDEAVVVKIARAYEPSTEDVDSALRQIEAAVEGAIALRRRLGAVSNHGKFADLVLNRMRELAARGELAGAADEASVAWAAEEAGEEEERRARAARRAALAAEAVSVARQGNEPEVAASWALRGIEAGHPADPFALLEAAVIEWFDRGRARGLAFDLAVAAELARLASDRAPDPAARSIMLRWGGVALQELAWRSGRRSHLRGAISVFEAASRVAWKGGEKGGWLEAMMSLTMAYQDTARMAGDTDRLGRCITCLEALVAMVTQDEEVRMGGLVNLATMRTELASAAELQGGARSEAEQAVFEYREALEWRLRAGHKEKAGLILNNLGRTLMIFHRLEEAVGAFGDALRMRPGEDEPMRWAMTKHNLACALLSLAARDRSLGHARDALEQAHEALEERRRDRSPVEWALTTLSVGEIHRLRATLLSDPNERRLAAEALSSARAAFADAGEAANVRKVDDTLANLRP